MKSDPKSWQSKYEAEHRKVHALVNACIGAIDAIKDGPDDYDLRCLENAVRKHGTPKQIEEVKFSERWSFEN